MKPITYTDTKTGSPFEGMCLTGGFPEGEQVRFDPVRLPGREARQRPGLLIATRPDLARLVAEYRAAEAVEAWRPEGHAALAALVSRKSHEEDRVRRTWESENVRACDNARRSVSALDDLLTIEQAKYPAARLWIWAEGQEVSASWSDPTGKVPAARECKRLIREGRLAEAEVALAVRTLGYVD